MATFYRGKIQMALCDRTRGSQALERWLILADYQAKKKPIFILMAENIFNYCR